MKTNKPETAQQMDARAEFEAWITSPPYEKPVDVNPESSAWPGQYRAYEVQLAWEAYQAGRAECEELRKDAERYRWLREAHTAHPINLTICSANDWGLKPWSGDDPDAAIDAAMAGDKP